MPPTIACLVPEGGWSEPAHTRLVPPPLERRGAVFRAVSRLSSWFGRPELPDVFAVLHLHPRLFWAWLFFASRLMPYGRLPARVREKLILRTAWNCRSRYEWGQHVDLALAAGVTDAEIVALTQGPDAAADPLERALVASCDELCERDFVGEGTWHTLAAHFDRARVIEIVMLVGHYRMLAGFLNSAGLALEPWVEERLAAFHRRVAERPT
jgi:alkylhydroperoxidase family enzyme